MYNPYGNYNYGMPPSFQQNQTMMQRDMQNQQYLQQTQQQQIVRVNGRNGAEAFQMAPNSSILLLDSNSPIIWLKMTDGAGYPTITPYNITPMKDTKEINCNSSEIAILEDRVTKLEGIVNAKSNIGTDAGESSKKQ